MDKREVTPQFQQALCRQCTTRPCESIYNTDFECWLSLNTPEVEAAWLLIAERYKIEKLGRKANES